MRDKGTYKARGVSASLGEAQTGTAFVHVLFNLESGGQESYRGYLTEKTYASTVKALRACGWEGDDLSDLRGIDRNDVFLVIDHEADDKGVMRARVKWVNSTESGIPMAVPTARAKELAAMWKGKIVQERQAAGGNAATGTGEKLPF